MDVQCQDEFLHRTDPCREQERINVTFRWIKQHAVSCLLFKAGVACCLSSCAAFISSCYEERNFRRFLGSLTSARCLVHLESTSVPGLPVVYKTWVTLVCLLLDTPFGRHHLCNLWGECLAAHKTACKYFAAQVEFMMWKPHMLASAGQPSLNGYYACVVYWHMGALRRTCRQKHGKTSFSPFRVFLFCRNSRVLFWGLVLWHLWIRRAKHPGPASPSQHFGLEGFNVGGWLTHGDLALETRVDFLVVVEHRLIPARVRSGVGKA